MKIAKVLSISGILLVMGLTAYGCRHGGHFKKFCSEDFPENFLVQIDKRVKDLKFTGEQQAKYNEIRTLVKADMTAGRDDRLQKLDDLNDQLAKQSPDLESIARNFKKHHDEQHAKRNEKFNKYFDHLLELYKMLDKDQQARVVERLREAAKRFNCK